MHFNVTILLTEIMCIRPDVNFHCTLNHDPFLFMEDSRKVYGM